MDNLFRTGLPYQMDIISLISRNNIYESNQTYGYPIEYAAIPITPSNTEGVFFFRGLVLLRPGGIIPIGIEVVMP